MRNIKQSVIGLLFVAALFAVPAFAAGDKFAVVQKAEGTKTGSGIVFDVVAGDTLTIPLRVTGGTPPYTVTWTVYPDDRQIPVTTTVVEGLTFSLEGFRPQDRGYYWPVVKDSTGKAASPASPIWYANWKR